MTDHSPDVTALPETAAFVEPIDSTLDLLTRFASGGLSIGVTLAIPPGLVSGHLIPRSAYLRVTVDLLNDGLAKGGLRELGATLQAISGPDTEPETPAAMFEGAPDPFLYLEDARYLLGGATMVPADVGLVLKVRKAQIASWSLGRVTPNGAPRA
ncbi:MAG TPA: hypothetical protein VGD56_10455 [Gemmatirosa sp.]